MVVRVSSGASMRNRLRANAASGGGGPVFPLNGYPTPAYAFSTRRLLTSYTGPFVRVRCDTGTYAGSEYDVAFSGTSGISGSNAVTFVSGSSGAATMVDLLGGSANIFVTTVYDQGPNGFHVTQTTTTLQPQIAAAGALIPLDTSLPNALCDGSTSANKLLTRASIATAAMLTGGVEMTNCTVARMSASSGAYGMWGWGNGINNGCGFGWVGSVSYLDTPEAGSRVSIAGTLTTAQQWTTWRQSATATIRRNGTQVAQNTSATGTISGTWPLHICSAAALFATAPNWAGLIGESVHWNTKISDVSISAFEANQKAFWGTP